MSSTSAVPPASQSPAFPAATRFAALLVVVWLVAMAQLLWYFEQQRLTESQQLMRFEAGDLPGPPSAAPAGIAKAIYFVDPQCRCAAAALAEVRRLQRAMSMPLAQFVTTSAALAGIDAQPLDAAERARWRDRVPATAAVALWDTSDRLIYFGPLSIGNVCGGGAAANSYLQAALQSLSQPMQQPMQELEQQQLVPQQVVQQRTDASFKAWDVVACACAT